MSETIEAALAQLDDDAPEAPPREVCAALLAELARAIELGGFARFVRPPVARDLAVPDPYLATPFGVGVVLLRLFDHAGLALDVRIRDIRAEADRRRNGDDTVAMLVEVADGCATFELRRIGASFDSAIDQIGVAALRSFEAVAPYRDAPRDFDRELLRRGAIAAVYLGLGVLAADAAMSVGPAHGSVRAGLAFRHVGQLGVDELAFLVAVQAIVRDDTLPLDLDGVQDEAARAWHVALTGLGDDLRAALAIPPPDQWEDVERPAPGPLARAPIVEGGEPAPSVARVIARHTGAGGAIGGVFTIAATLAAGVPVIAAGAIAVAAAGYGAYVGRGMKHACCSACGARIVDGAAICTGCGGAIR